MLYVLEDIGYWSPAKIQALRQKAKNAKGLTLGFIAYLAKSLGR